MCTVWPSRSKWLSEQSKESASDFVLSLNIAPWKLLGWFRRPQLWATGDWQLHHDNTPSHASYLVQSVLAKHPMIQPCYSPDLVPCNFWLFPKLKSLLKGKRFQTVCEIQENKTGQLMAMGELCEVPRCLLWRELRCHCPMYNVSCILCLLQQMSLFFILCGRVPAGHASDMF